MIPRQSDFKTKAEDDGTTVVITAEIPARSASVRIERQILVAHHGQFDDAVTSCQMAVFASLYGDVRTRLQVLRKAFNRRYDDQEMLVELTKILEMLELRP